MAENHEMNLGGAPEDTSEQLTGDMKQPKGVYLGIDNTNNKPVIINTFRAESAFTTSLPLGLNEFRPHKGPRLADIYSEARDFLKQLEAAEEFDSLSAQEHRKLLSFHPSVTILE